MLRLWSLLSVTAPPSVRSSVLAAIVYLGIWCGVDWLYAQPDPQFFLANTPLLAWYALAILAMAALLRWRANPSPGFAATFALAVGSVPIPLLLSSLGGTYLSLRWLWDCRAWPRCMN